MNALVDAVAILSANRLISEQIVSKTSMKPSDYESDTHTLIDIGLPSFNTVICNTKHSNQRKTIWSMCPRKKLVLLFHSVLSTVLACLVFNTQKAIALVLNALNGGRSSEDVILQLISSKRMPALYFMD